MTVHCSTDRPLTCIRASLHHLALGAEDPEALAAFYARALGYRVQDANGVLTGVARDRRLVFVKGKKKTFAYAGFEVADAAELERLVKRITIAGWKSEPMETPFFTDALAVCDPDGNRFVFGVPSAPEREAVDDVATLQARLQHIVITSRDAKRVASFFTDVLGFTLSDVVIDDEGAVRTSFLRSTHEHHSFAVFQASECRLDHHCYETPDWNAIRDWGDHMARERIEVKWGPGRHGPGDNLFLFIHDAEGNWVELSAELESVPHARVAGRWPHEQRTLNTWGQAFLRN